MTPIWPGEIPSHPVCLVRGVVFAAASFESL
jgi:hypothetical protein